jgi:hypothetical protein
MAVRGRVEATPGPRTRATAVKQGAEELVALTLVEPAAGDPATTAALQTLEQRFPIAMA